jgi:S-DNA-T family DNA segregation ATPase FtsK/SpoIIIE
VARAKSANANAKSNDRISSFFSGDGFFARVSIEVVGLGLLGISLLSTLALATYSPADPVAEWATVVNRAGVVGATLAGGLFGAIGYGAPIVVAGSAWLGGRMVLGVGAPALRSRFWPGSILLIVALASLPLVLHGLAPGRLGSPLESRLGNFLVSGEVMLLSHWGALLINGMIPIVALLSIAGISSGRAMAAVASGSALVGSVTITGVNDLWVAVRRFLAQRRSRDRSRKTKGGWLSRLKIELPTSLKPKKRNRRLPEAPVFEASDDEAASDEESEEGKEEEEWEEGEGEWEEGDEEWEYEEGEEGEEEEDDAEVAARRPVTDAPPDIVDHDKERAAKKSPTQETFEFRDEGPRGPYVLPDISIFHKADSKDCQYDRESLLMNSRILEKKLLDFGVKGRVVRVHPGPVITMYEYEPAAGIKVNRIVNLTDDLAMALRAIAIRIIAPLPGKSVVGIEIPNPKRDVVYLRSQLESEAYRSNNSVLGIAMGDDIFGNAVTSDLGKMPHLLVAGATGTGKSVFLNSFLCSLLCRATPDELKLLLIDPKLLELSVYEGIPHLIADVVTNPKRAAAALQGVVRKMEERYAMMSAVRVRNITQFNEKVDTERAEGNTTFQLRLKPGETEAEEVEWVKLPYIVVVIDELADLMVMVAKEVEESLQRLAQMARAAGIHLVLATQRPSVDVLTGVIKANFPSRLSFQVSSAIDSRTVLDQKGAENLLGMGDMLFLPPGTSVLQRLHGAFVDEKEVNLLVEHLRAQGKPDFDEDLSNLQLDSDLPEHAGGEAVDEMFDQAVAIVSETRNASISYIQRRLKIGYNRAARIIEAMENQQMIGAQVGTRARDVFLRALDDEE